MWKLLSESILKKPRRSKDRKKSAIKRKLEKDLQKATRMQTKAWTLLDGGRQLYYQKKNMHSCINARIRRELILNYMIH
jgi:hypothetical protein